MATLTLDDLIQAQRKLALEKNPTLDKLEELKKIASRDQIIQAASLVEERKIRQDDDKLVEEIDEGMNKRSGGSLNSNVIQILKELKSLSKNVTKAFNDIKTILQQEHSILKENGKSLDILSKEFVTQFKEKVAIPTGAVAGTTLDPKVVASPLASTLGGLVGNEEQQNETLKLVNQQTGLLEKIEENTQGLKQKITPVQKEDTEESKQAESSSFFDDISSTFKNIAAGITGLLGGAAIAKKTIIPKVENDNKVKPEESPKKKGGLLRDITGKLAGGAAKGLGVLGIGIETYAAHQEIEDIKEQQKAGLITPEKAEEMKASTVGIVGGGLAGAAIGATKGAAIGSVVPVVGTAVGGLLGGAAGYMGGSFLGKEYAPTLWKDTKEFFGIGDENKVNPEQQKESILPNIAEKASSAFSEIKEQASEAIPVITEKAGSLFNNFKESVLNLFNSDKNISTQNIQSYNTQPQVNALHNFRSMEPNIAQSVYENSSNVVNTSTAPTVISTPTVINAPVTSTQQMQNIVQKGGARNTESSYQQYNISRFVF